MRDHLSDRFWAKVDRTGDCWLWTAATSRNYGQMRDGHQMVYVHRVSWELANGPIPNGHGVLHHCDTPLCVRPSHLFTGPQSVNVADMDSKGRHRVSAGDANPNRKLSSADVLEIRALARTGPVSRAALARRYGVTKTSICSVISHKTWSHIA